MDAAVGSFHLLYFPSGFCLQPLRASFNPASRCVAAGAGRLHPPEHSKPLQRPYRKVYVLEAANAHESAAHSRWRKQLSTWSLTIPIACICAYMMVGPTKENPRLLRSLLSAREVSVSAGISERER